AAATAMARALALAFFSMGLRIWCSCSRALLTALFSSDMASGDEAEEPEPDEKETALTGEPPVWLLCLRRRRTHQRNADAKTRTQITITTETSRGTRHRT